MKKPMARKWKIVFWAMGSITFIVSVFVGFVGYLHTPRGRELPIAQTLLTALGYKCPVTEVSAAQLTQIRKAAFALGPQTDKVAPRKWAFGFQLGVTAPAEVLKWAADRKVVCTERTRGYHYVECRDVANRIIGSKEPGSLDELTFSFDENLKLIAVNILRDKLGAEQASSILNGLKQQLTGLLGEPTRKIGDPSATNLQARYSGAGFDFNFKDYVASVSAAHLPSGVSLYERYMTTVD